MILRTPNRLPKLAPNARSRSMSPQMRGTALRQTAGVGPGPISRRAVRKIGKHWLNKPDVITMRDDREICNPATVGGCAEYKWRVLLMWVRQYGLCCNCWRPLSLRGACFEHELGRTKARRDDRIAVFDDQGRFVRHLNGASHVACNSRRGSRRTEIFHGNNCAIEKESA